MHVFTYFLPNEVLGNHQATRLVSGLSSEKGERNGEQMLDNEHFEIGHMQL